jgi:hypothetical protein
MFSGYRTSARNLGLEGGKLALISLNEGREGPANGTELRARACQKKYGEICVLGRQAKFTTLLLIVKINYARDMKVLS